MQLCNPLQVQRQLALQVMTLPVKIFRQATAALMMMRVQHSLRVLQHSLRVLQHNLTCE